MGMKAQELVTRAGIDLHALIKELNSAYCDEWLAYYQYWIGAKVIEGKMVHVVAGELAEHAGEELEHAEKLAKRIIELGGTPAISPDLWLKDSTCGYLAPENPAPTQHLTLAFYLCLQIFAASKKFKYKGHFLSLYLYHLKQYAST